MCFESQNWGSVVASREGMNFRGISIPSTWGRHRRERFYHAFASAAQHPNRPAMICSQGLLKRLSRVDTQVEHGNAFRS